MMSSRFNHGCGDEIFERFSGNFEIDSCFSGPYIKLNTFSISDLHYIFDEDG